MTLQDFISVHVLALVSGLFGSLVYAAYIDFRKRP